MRLPLIVLIISYTVSIIGLLLIDGIDDKGYIYNMSIFDAFYFITYTASTIGFGETPYSFTYNQKIWILFCIYILCYILLYAGTILSILKDQTFSK